MRILFGIVIGLLAGFAAATWFYGQGGNIIVDGHAIFPRTAAPSAPTPPGATNPTPTAPTSTTPRRENRVVVRDVTDEPPPPVSTPPAPRAAPSATPPPAATANPAVTRYELGPSLVVLVPRF